MFDLAGFTYVWEFSDFQNLFIAKFRFLLKPWEETIVLDPPDFENKLTLTFNFVDVW